MNVLDAVGEILNKPNLFLGILPENPSELIALFEYAGLPPTQYFNTTEYTYYIQARTRAKEAKAAYLLAESVQATLNGYSDAELTISQTSNILGIGQDSKGRQEYTVNFKIQLKG